MFPVAIDIFEMGRLEFPVAINEIDIFEWNNDISMNVLAVEREEDKLYILKMSGIADSAELRRTINLLLIDQEEKRH